jgi:hypothetical protein
MAFEELKQRQSAVWGKSPYQRITDDERREELHRSWVDFADSELADNGGVEHKREWILVYGTRR